MENVKQNTIKYKILFIFSFLLLTLLLFNTNVFASFNINYNDTIHTLPDIAESYTYSGTTYNTSDFANKIIFYIKSSDEYRIFLTNRTFKIGQQGSSYCYQCHTFLELILPSGSNNYSVGYVSGITGYMTTSFRSIDIIYSNVDIYDFDNNMVFQVPVPETLAQVLEKERTEKPEMVLKEVLLILPLIIVTVVSLVGLRKALRMLSMLLHRA